MAPKKHNTTGIPRDLKDELASSAKGKQLSGATASLKKVVGRKDRRKLERQEKKFKQISSHQAHANHTTNAKSLPKSAQQKPKATARLPPPPKQRNAEPESEDEPEPPRKKRKASPDHDEAASKKVKSILKSTKPIPKSEMKPAGPIIPKDVQKKLANDDAEIAYLEKQLGMKPTKSKKLPKAFEEDGLDFLLEGIDDIFKHDVVKKKKKRKTEESDSDSESGDSEHSVDADGWGTDQDSESEPESGSDSAPEERGKETEFKGFDDEEEEEVEEEDGSEADHEDDHEEGDFDEDDFDDEDDEEEEEAPKPAPKAPRPSIYKPHVEAGSAEAAAAAAPAKYIPPSLRKAMAGEDESMTRLRRQAQGLVNRLSEANLLSIVAEIENLYRTNARANVNKVMSDILITMTCDASSLLDTFMILHAGFITAIYKIIGTDFGAHFVQTMVEKFDTYYEAAQKDKPEANGKQCINLISLMSEFYNLQMVGAVLIFDYMRLFLSEITELNTELLLKIIRNSGHQLRQDDPTALKDVVVMMQPAISRIGSENLSTRTKFMIETITNLKNNKLKNAAANSALISESTIRMKKVLGTLNSRQLRATEPLRASLADIRNTETKGKWWLVGASWNDPNKVGNGTLEDKPVSKTTKPTKEDESFGEVTDLTKIARQQGMNTDIRRAIFVTIMSSEDYKDAFERLLKLRLKRSQEVEIPRVVVHCACNEKVYNPYYTLLARRLSTQHSLKMAFQFCLWQQFRRLGEDDGRGDDDERIPEAEDEDESMTMRKLVNLARMYSTLVAEDIYDLSLFKTLNLTYLQPKTALFMELFFVNFFLLLHKKSKKTSQLFARTSQNPDLMKGLLWFLKKKVVKTDLGGGDKENKRVREAARESVGMLKGLVTAQALGTDSAFAGYD